MTKQDYILVLVFLELKCMSIWNLSQVAEGNKEPGRSATTPNTKGGENRPLTLHYLSEGRLGLFPNT